MSHLCPTLALAGIVCSASLASAAEPRPEVFPSRRDAASMLIRYFERTCTPKPFEIREAEAFRAHQRELRTRLLACAGLWPLPERVPLDVHASKPLDHEWCTIRRIYYRLWPGVYGDGLLFLPKGTGKGPGPAVLCPHGHWRDGSAHPEVQRRCLVLAKLGYVVFSPTQDHYEDPALGISHQTLMVWGNMRALDYLQSLPQVDGTRIGCAGASGGGLQTQMLVAVDARVRAATICGMTCDYREIVFPGRTHCGCNHFPSIMRYTDEPEISALGLPTPVQYLTMNDWTRSFAKNNYPTIRRLYEANGLKGRVDCKYWPTGHSYDKPKRERTYWWMDKWLRGIGRGEPIAEPEVKTLPVKTLLALEAAVPASRGFRHITRLYEKTVRYATPRFVDRQAWVSYRDAMRSSLRELLSTPAASPKAETERISVGDFAGLAIERLLCASEEGILVPVIVLRPANAEGKLPAAILCSDAGKAALRAAKGAGSAMALARAGSLVALPDVRFVGELSLSAFAGQSKKLVQFRPCSPLPEGKPNTFRAAWERNAMLWGRPLPGMAATDLRCVVAYVARRDDVDRRRIRLVARGNVAVAALFAAAADERVSALDIHLGGRCFETRNLPLVPFVLRHGDVLQWAALLADRRLTLGGVPKEAGDPEWLRHAFEAVGNAGGLKLPSGRSREGN
ncbi:MAG: hypothetical protein ISS72_06950 [Candidatus Brocadiae bacterium]|nr:hypothetical protein [Candidatus Brocadiia bacterium]